MPFFRWIEELLAATACPAAGRSSTDPATADKAEKKKRVWNARTRRGTDGTRANVLDGEGGRRVHVPEASQRDGIGQAPIRPRLTLD